MTTPPLEGFDVSHYQTITDPRGDLADFSIAKDDDGESEPVFAGEGWSEERIADALAEVALA